VRQKLINGEAIELTKAPPSVTWVALGGGDDHARKLRAAATPAREVNGGVLIIGDGKRPESQRQIASQTPGAITVEAVDLRDLVRFAKELDLRKPGNALLTSIYFAASVMTNVGAENLIQRLKSLVAGTARTEATQLEQIALTFLGAPSVNNLLELFEAIGKEAGVRTHRPVVLRSCIKALQACDIEAEDGFYNAVLRMREENRLAGRPLPRRAVGSTLLLKGLEAEVVAVLETDLLDAKNLYVALTRGSTSVVVCSRSSTIQRPPVR
jgi:DNA helicase-2/ATP-dependent DNA helicase PcrA